MNISQQVQYAAWRYGEDENGYDYYDREEDITKDVEVEESEDD